MRPERDRAMRNRYSRCVLAIAALLCLIAAPAIAGDRPWEQERWHTTYAGFDASGDDFLARQQWLELQRREDGRHEFGYDRGLSLNLEENFVFSIQSPFAGEWAPGFAFELRF